MTNKELELLINDSEKQIEDILISLTCRVTNKEEYHLPPIDCSGFINEFNKITETVRQLHDSSSAGYALELHKEQIRSQREHLPYNPLLNGAIYYD